ncbi:MAG: serine hydrolase [Oscillospiraceae bacterium]|nr:serine hydrolase [Oscillospiraceae bacterium]
MANFEKLDRLLEGFVEDGLPGCAMQIVKDGETIYEKYFGYADVENKKPVTKDSLFRLASMSKIPLYTAAMMLYEQGKFNLTDPVGDYLPEWKESKKFLRKPNGEMEIVPTSRPMEVTDILSMKCGLPYCHTNAYTEDPTVKSMQECMKPLWEKGHFTVQEHIAAMSKATLAYDPGEHWTYGFSSEITAAFLEVVSGKDIDTLFKDLLFDPLEMNNTRSHFFGDAQDRLVKFYGWNEDGSLKQIVSPMDEKHLPGPEHEAGWARLFTCANDYANLLGMLANGGVYKGQRIMGRKTIDLMRANGLHGVQIEELQSDGYPYNAGYGYGYGVRTLIDKAGGNHNGSLGSFGWTGGFGTWCEADPEDGVGLVYLHNTSPNNEVYYHHRVRNVAYGCLD